MLTGKCDVRTSTPGPLDRGLVVRIASIAPGALPASTFVGITSVADSATDVQLLAAAIPGTRIKWSITNDSTVTLYVAIGGSTASTTNYSVPIPANGGYFESVNDLQVVCEVRGIWASDPNTGAARITEYFP